MNNLSYMCHAYILHEYYEMQYIFFNCHENSQKNTHQTSMGVKALSIANTNIGLFFCVVSVRFTPRPTSHANLDRGCPHLWGMTRMHAQILCVVSPTRLGLHPLSSIHTPDARISPPPLDCQCDHTSHRLPC